MKNILLLSSSRFLSGDPPLNLPRPLKDLRLAYVTTASKGVTDKAYLERTEKIFAQNGYQYREFDLDGQDESGLEKELSGFDGVFMQGGNTFYLLRAIRASGFDKIIPKLLARGFLYIGASAGAYVACPTIEMAGLKRQDKYDHYGITDLTGLGLVPFLLSVHYLPEYESSLREKISACAYPVRILTDQQALLVQDDTVQLLGEGKEIQL